jgi:hypothetical protein
VLGGTAPVDGHPGGATYSVEQSAHPKAVPFQNAKAAEYVHGVLQRTLDKLVSVNLSHTEMLWGSHSKSAKLDDQIKRVYDGVAKADNTEVSRCVWTQGEHGSLAKNWVQENLKEGGMMIDNSRSWIAIREVCIMMLVLEEASKDISNTPFDRQKSVCSRAQFEQ